MAGRDQYMNFFTLDVTTGASSATLVNENFNTGAGVATMLAWRIHLVEWHSSGSWSGAADGNRFRVSLSTRKDLSSIPTLNDKGTICMFNPVATVYGAGTGSHIMQYPQVVKWLPPILVASPNFSIYAQGSADFAGQQQKKQELRIGFTTEKLTESAYREVFETWNYAN